MPVSCRSTTTTTAAANVKATKPIAYNTNTLTFLKSNYKYKRRSDVPTNAFSRAPSAGPAPSTGRRRIGIEGGAHNRIVCKIIFRLFILFIGNLMPHIMQRRAISHTSRASARQRGRRGADVCVDGVEMNRQRNYDKVSARRCRKAAAFHHRPRRDSSGGGSDSQNNNNNNKNGNTNTGSISNSNSSSSQSRDLSSSTSSTLSMLTWRHLNATPTDVVSRANIGLSTLAVLFMALALNVRNVDAGACWRASKENGRCSEIYLRNSTKAECCQYPELFFTDREVSNVEIFFSESIGNGMECAPCMASCRNVQCGLHKKCIKRKGRPKCVCAPECGAAARRRRYQRKMFRGHEQHSEQLPRDIRSLSSEITNINLGVRQQNQNQNQNQSQRKLIILQSQSQQKPQLHKAEAKPERLLISANVEQPGPEKPTTTRRLQILSNVRAHHRHHKGDAADGGGGGGGDTVRRGKSDSLRATAEARRGSNMSRHKANNNSNGSRKPHENELQSSRQQEDETANNNNNNNNNSNSNNNYAKLKHIHENVRKLENAPNHDEVVAVAVDSRHHDERHQQLHRKRKHHHRPKQHRLKDHNANDARARATTSTSTTLTPFATINTASAAATTATIRTLQTATTPVNSTSPTLPMLLLPSDRRSSSHGSKTADSSSPTTSPQWHTRTPTSSAAFFGGDDAAAAVNHHADGGKSSINSDDDLILLDRFYNFDTYRFPNWQFELTHQHHEQAQHPVCGTDGRTYNTECQLKKRACRTDNPTLVVAYRGHCKTTCNGVVCLNGLKCVEDHYAIPHCIGCKIDCPEDDRSDVIDPSRAVCGVDGKTYKSTCDINRMICKIGRSIAVAYPGPCRADRVTCSDINCGSRRTCLVDLLTHEPRCVSCQYKCSRKRRPPSLRFEEGKICGANERTYNSWCEMRKDSCNTGFFIDVKSAGECH